MEENNNECPLRVVLQTRRLSAFILNVVILRPDMLLLDEPTGDLDTLNTIRIMNLLVELNNMGTTLIMVTHDMMLPSIATRVVVMSDGRVNNILYNSDETRYSALQKLNEGIEDLTVGQCTARQLSQA